MPPQLFINILPSFSSAGIKLKLLNVLYNGRHCIANNETLSGSGFDSLCIVANSADEFINATQKYFLEEFNKEADTLLRSFEPVPHKEILHKLLSQIEKIDFREKAGLTDESEKIQRKH